MKKGHGTCFLKSAGQRSNILLTGGCSSTISFLVSAKVESINWLIKTASGVLFITSVWRRCLWYSKADPSWSWGKFGRKFVSHLLAFLMHLVGGSPSSLWFLLPLLLTATSGIHNLCSLERTLPIFQNNLFFHPRHPVLDPGSARHGCFFVRACTTSKSWSLFGYTVYLQISSASFWRMLCLMSFGAFRRLPFLKKTRFPCFNLYSISTAKRGISNVDSHASRSSAGAGISTSEELLELVELAELMVELIITSDKVMDTLSCEIIFTVGLWGNSATSTRLQNKLNSGSS